MTSVPRPASSQGSTVNSPLPSDSQRTPSPAGKPGAAGEHRHAVGDDERRVEPDAELADQLRVPGLVARELAEELPRARPRDRAQVFDHLLSRHADPVVAHADRACLAVEPQADRELGVALVVLRPVDRLETQLVARVRGVGDQFAQEDLAVAVQRVDHQLQQLLDFGLKAECFLHVHGVEICKGGGHGRAMRPSAISGRFAPIQVRDRRLAPAANGRRRILDSRGAIAIDRSHCTNDFD